MKISTVKRPDSFFLVFDYSHLEHDAMDHALVYHSVIITRDIITEDGITLLKKGNEYEQVTFYFDKQSFYFIVWEPSKDGREFIPNRQSLMIAQKDLAPFLVW